MTSTARPNRFPPCVSGQHTACVGHWTHAPNNRPATTWACACQCHEEPQP
jgi:hypothetical protein